MELQKYGLHFVSLFSGAFFISIVKQKDSFTCPADFVAQRLQQSLRCSR